MAFNYIDRKDVEEIHQCISKKAMGTNDPVTPSGLKSLHLLESAISRQYTSIGTLLKYNTVEKLAATILFGISRNHPFHNGNKRTALVSCLVLLERNYYLPKKERNVTHKDFYDLVLAIASPRKNINKKEAALRRIALNEGLRKNEFRRYKEQYPRDDDDELDIIADWIGRKTRKANMQDKVLTVNKLKKILQNQKLKKMLQKQKLPEITIEIKKGKLKIMQDINIFKKIKHSMSCSNEHMELNANRVREIRKKFSLTPEHGVDSTVFYSKDIVIDSILSEYSNILNKLSKT